MSSGLDEVLDAWIDDLLDRAPVPPQTLDDALARVRAYRDDPAAASAWTGLEKSVWCGRIEQLLADPTILDQRPTGYCMPASCLYVLFKRVPLVMAGFCVALARDGAGTIRDLTITMSAAIRHFGIAEHAGAQLQPIHVVDYALMLALQQAMSSTDLDSPDSYAARPGVAASNIEDLLTDTDLFRIQRISKPAASDLAGLDPATEVILVGSVSLFSLSHNVDHAAVLIPPLETSGGQVTLRFWSWGMFQGNQTLPIEGGYYVAHVSEAVFKAKLDAAILVTLQGS